MMQGIVPEARLAVDPTSRSLIAVAMPADQQTIKSTLDQLQEKRPDPTALELRYYPVAEGTPAELMQAILAVVPTAKVTPDNKLKRLMIVATSDDHDKIKAAIAQIAKGTPETTVKESLARFPVNKSLKAQFDAVWSNVSQDHPGVKIIPTADAGILSVWGTPPQHELVKGILEGLKKNSVDDPTTLEIRYHSFPDGIPTTLTQAITALAPAAQVTPDTVHKRLMVVAMPEDQEKVKRAIDQVMKEAPKTEKGTLVIYPVTTAQKTRFEAVLPNLREDMPDLKIIPTTENGLLSVWATPSQHELLKGVLEELGKNVPPAEKYQLAVHSLKHVEGPGAVTVLQTLFPNLKVTHDTTTNRLMIWGTTEQLGRGNRPWSRLTPMPLPRSKISSWSIPCVRLTRDCRRRPAIHGPQGPYHPRSPRSHPDYLFARPAEQELVAKTLQKLNQELLTPPNRPSVAYQPKTPPPTISTSLISSAVPTAKLVIDPRIGGCCCLGHSHPNMKIASLVKRIWPYFEGDNAPPRNLHPTKMAPSQCPVHDHHRRPRDHHLLRQ
ncbi:MAG: hypothetical protein U0903_11130 [Planctomycetales bacterium]